MSFDTSLTALRDAGYPRLADFIKEYYMTATGVIPHHQPVPAYCGARDDDTGRVCDLDQGHDGPHQSIITITWLDPADEPL